MIQIECNEHTLLTSFEVLELQYPFVIGMDLFCKLGFAIGGIADGRADAHLLPNSIPDQKPGILPIKTAAEELTDSLKQEKKRFSPIHSRSLCQRQPHIAVQSLHRARNGGIS